MSQPSHWSAARQPASAGRRAVAAGAALLAAALCASLPAGCDKAESAKGAAAPAPPPPAVTVAHPISRRVVDRDEYVGHLASTDMVNLQARVSGQIVEA